MTLSEATQAYQDLIEGRRRLTHWDGHQLAEEVDQMIREARTALEIAWLNQIA